MSANPDASVFDMQQYARELNFDLQDTNWEDTWQNWDLATIMKSSQTLDGNWEDKIQIDIVDERLPTTSVTNYWKYSWAGINSTWDSLT